MPRNAPKTPPLLVLSLLGPLLLVPLLLVAGCGADPGPSPAAQVSADVRLDAHRWLGEPLTVANLRVWPVHTDAPLDVGEFLTLEEAEAKALAEVREVGGQGAGRQRSNEPVGPQRDIGPAGQQGLSGPPAPNRPPPVVIDGDGAGLEDERAQEERPEPLQEDVLEDGPGQRVVPQRDVQQLDVQQLSGGGGAQVNTLEIENRGDLPILVCAGTIVKGGQQDRQIGEDVVIAAHTTVAVEAFCVEPGRWHLRAGGSAGFSNAGQGMALKSVRLSGQYEKDQQKVWAEVKEVLHDAGVEGTDTLVAANEQADEGTKQRRVRMETEVLRYFRSLATSDDPPVGFAYAIDGKPVSVRAFAHERILDGQLPGFVKAMCAEAELALGVRDAVSGAIPSGENASAKDVVALVRSLGRAEERLQRTAAANWNGVRENEVGFNGACYLTDETGQAVDPESTITVDWSAR